jgi:uncharacterized membrane protein
MISLGFVLGTMLLFVALLSVETAASGGSPRIRSFGLIGWLTSGNWPAKVGAGLLIIGVGALLRYALINIDIPDDLKLMAGVLAALVLAAASFVLRGQPQRRALCLALAGAALGVAYLTAYSAYALFSYLPQEPAFALLVVVAVAGGLLAVQANALSIAVLAMLGAYLAPAFGLGDPGPVAVYGYYLAISALSFAMVRARGWRAVIHLSFLFTLAGGLFFGWTRQFYTATYFDQMLPLLLAVIALHLAMPIAEWHAAKPGWEASVDSGYRMLLPLVAVCSMLVIAPDLHREGAISVALLGVLWLAAAGTLRTLRKGEQEGAQFHLVIAILLFGGALLLALHDLPWSLLGMGLATVLFLAAPRLKWARETQELLCVLLLTCGLFHMAGKAFIFHPEPGMHHFIHKMLASVLLVVVGLVGSSRKIGLASVLGWAGAVWGALALVSELLRLNLEMLPQIVFGVLLAVAVLNAAGIIFLGKSNVGSAPLTLFAWLITALGWWAAHSASDTLDIAFALAVPCTMLVLVRACLWTTKPSSHAFCLLLLPLALLPWALALDGDFAIQQNYLAGVLMLSSTLFVALLSPRIDGGSDWRDSYAAWVFTLVSLVMLLVTVIHIERGVLPILVDILGMTTLIIITRTLSAGHVGGGKLQGAIVVLLTMLVVQAMVLRVLGPADPMSALDLVRMRLPAIVSLMWAVLGAGLTIWGHRSKSRGTWSFGAFLLAVAAAKLVLLDFGSLGQLANIVAMILAGLLFLLVSWLAPFPPAAPEPAPIPVKPVAPPGPNVQAMNQPVTDAEPAAAAAQPAQTVAAGRLPDAPATAAAMISSRPSPANRMSVATVDNTSSVLRILGWLVIALVVVIALNAYRRMADAPRRQAAMQQRMDDARARTEAAERAATEGIPPHGPTAAAQAAEQAVRAAEGAARDSVPADGLRPTNKP